MAREPLEFRLIHPVFGGTTLSVTRHDDLAFQAAGHLVRNMLQPAAMNAPINALAGYTPEVLAQHTLERIAALERSLNACRNALIDSQTVDRGSRWDALIDQAGQVLGIIE